MSTFEAVRCDQCGKEEKKNWHFKGNYTLPVNWMTVNYAIPTSNPTGNLYGANYRDGDFCSITCRNAWEAENLPQKGGEE